MTEIIFKTNDHYYPLATSKCGKVKNLITNNIRNTPTGSHGYPIISSRNLGTLCVHRMVAEIWIPNPESKPCVNHIDSDRTNNNTCNLEWATYKENSQHAAAKGLIGKSAIKGEDSNLSLYSDDLIHQVCKELQDGCRNIDVANKYGISKQYIKDLKSGKARTCITKQYNLKNFDKRSVSEDTVIWVCKCIVSGMSQRDILDFATNPRVTTTLIKNIRRKSSYKSISDSYF